ncbi:MAG: hypothetical protein LBU77_02655 [Clostridiales bacterium]|jgi:flagellar M-ring protein FliF|nr:hypothetical protein [Clostridiales bacterium]
MQERLRAILKNATDRWKSFGRSQQIRIVAVAVVFLAILGTAIFLAVRPKMYTLLNNEDPLLLVNAEATLTEAGIVSQLTNNGTALMINEQDLGAAKLQLETQNVFKDKKFTYLDALQYSTMGTTDAIKNENLRMAKETELEDTLMKMKGILGADVHLNIPGDSNFFLPDNTATASVLLETEGTLAPGQADTVARIVQRSVKNLELENIEVTDQDFNPLFSGQTVQAGGGLKTQYDAEMLMKSAIEAQIKKAASPIYDETNIISNLVFNWDKIQEQSKEYSNPVGADSAKGFVDGESSNKQSYEGASPDAEPGLAANNQETPTYQMNTGENSSAKIDEREANYIYNVVERIKEGSFGNLLSADSSIAVLVYRYTNYDETEMTESQRLNGMTWAEYKQNNKNAVEFDVDAAFVNSLVTGTGIANLSVVGYDCPTFTDRVVQPVRIDLLITLAILGILILLLAFGLLRRTQPDEVTEFEPELSVEDLLVSSQIDDRKESEAEKLREIELGLESEVMKQIEKFVNEKPDAVAQLLRNWISEDWE